MHQYNSDLRGEFEIVEAAAYLGIASQTGMRPPLRQRTQRSVSLVFPVVREPIPEVVVKPEPVAEVQPVTVLPETPKANSELASEEVNFSPRSNPSLKHGMSLATAQKKKVDSGLPIAEAFPEGDEDWWTILPGDPAGSLLVERIKLSEDDDGAMPPRGERLTKEEILIIEQ